MSLKVKVVADEQGNVVRVNPDKPDYGSIMLSQLVFAQSTGFMNQRNRVAFIAGKIEDLNAYVEAYGLTPGKELPGRIHVVESFTPHYEGQQPKLNPQNGRVMLYDDAQVYQKSFYDETGTKMDQFLTADVIQQGDVLPGWQPKAATPSILHTLRLSTETGSAQ